MRAVPIDANGSVSVIYDDLRIEGRRWKYQPVEVKKDDVVVFYDQQEFAGIMQALSTTTFNTVTTG